MKIARYLKYLQDVPKWSKIYSKSTSNYIIENWHWLNVNHCRLILPTKRVILLQTFVDEKLDGVVICFDNGHLVEFSIYEHGKNDRCRPANGA